MPYPPPHTPPRAACVVLAPGSHTSSQICFTKDWVGVAMGQQDKLLLFLCRPLAQLNHQSWAQNYPSKDWSFEWWTFSFSFFPNRNLAGNFHFRTKLKKKKKQELSFLFLLLFSCWKISGAFNFSPHRNVLCYFKSLFFSASLMRWQLCWWILFKKMTACRVPVLDGWLKFNSLHPV